MYREERRHKYSTDIFSWNWNWHFYLIIHGYNTRRHFITRPNGIGDNMKVQQRQTYDNRHTYVIIRPQLNWSINYINWNTDGYIERKKITQWIYPRYNDLRALGRPSGSLGSETSWHSRRVSPSLPHLWRSHRHLCQHNQHHSELSGTTS